MKTPRRAALRRLAATALAVLALSACGGDLRPGAAAVVGDNRITTERLREVVAAGLSDPTALERLGADREGFQRQVLSRLITTDLLETAAAQLGVEVSPGEVDARIAVFAEQAGSRAELETQAAQSGVPAAELRPFVRDLVLREKVGDELTEDLEVPDAQLRQGYQQNIARFDRIRTAHILVADKALADRLLAQVQADPSRFAALAAEFSTDEGNKDKGGDLGLAGRGDFVKEFEDAVFAAEDDTYLTVQTQFGHHVVHVIERRQTTFAQARPELRRQVLDEAIQAETAQLLQRLSREQGVSISPRFGRWDAEALTVTPYESPVVSPAPDERTDDGGEAEPPGDPGVPADPNAPPADPNAPPADPNAPPADPNAPTTSNG